MQDFVLINSLWWNPFLPRCHLVSRNAKRAMTKGLVLRIPARLPFHTYTPVAPRWPHGVHGESLDITKLNVIGKMFWKHLSDVTATFITARPSLKHIPWHTYTCVYCRSPSLLSFVSPNVCLFSFWDTHTRTHTNIHTLQIKTSDNQNIWQMFGHL